MDILLDGRMGYANGLVTDDRPAAGLCFVSSAEVPAAWRFPRPVCTELTAALLSTVRREFRPLVMPHGRFINIGPARVALFPTGPIPGAAALFIDHDGRKMLFCAGEPIEPAKLPGCDILIVRVGAASPAREAEVLAQIIDSARSAVRAGMVPVIRCNPIGVARPVCAAVAAAGMRVRAHKGVARFNRVWRLHGYEPGPATEFRGGDAAGSVVVMPDHLGDSPLEAGILHPWRIFVSRSGDESVSVPVTDQSMLMPGAMTPAQVVSLVAATRAVDVHLAGAGARECAAMLAKRDCRVTIFDPVRQVELL